MKLLSEAIRDGSMKTGKLEGGFASKSRSASKKDSSYDMDACALGAAYIELTDDTKGAASGSTVMDFISDTYPLVKDPECTYHREEIEAASGRLKEEYPMIDFPKELLNIKKDVEDLPEGKSCLCKTKVDIMNEIMSRNDGGESREDIADWLESIGL